MFKRSWSISYSTIRMLGNFLMHSIHKTCHNAEYTVFSIGCQILVKLKNVRKLLSKTSRCIWKTSRASGKCLSGWYDYYSFVMYFFVIENVTKSGTRLFLLIHPFDCNIFSRVTDDMFISSMLSKWTSRSQ